MVESGSWKHKLQWVSGLNGKCVHAVAFVTSQAGIASPEEAWLPRPKPQ
jgi:hypothetical protein